MAAGYRQAAVAVVVVVLEVDTVWADVFVACIAVGFAAGMESVDSFAAAVAAVVGTESAVDVAVVEVAADKLVDAAA